MISIIIVVSVVATIVFVLASLALFAVNAQITESEVSDEEVMSKSMALPDVQAFLEKYPKSTAEIQKGSDIWLTYTISKSMHEGHPIDQSNIIAAREDSYLYLWVISGNTKSFAPSQISLLCQGGDVNYHQNDEGWSREIHFQINGGIPAYLEQGKEERCFR